MAQCETSLHGPHAFQCAGLWRNWFGMDGAGLGAGGVDWAVYVMQYGHSKYGMKGFSR